MYDNLMGYSQLAAALRRPIQIGENFCGPRDLHNALRLKACDYVMPDFMPIGGFAAMKWVNIKDGWY